MGGGESGMNEKSKFAAVTRGGVLIEFKHGTRASGCLSRGIRDLRAIKEKA
jgi:hypothetical protein